MTSTSSAKTIIFCIVLFTASALVTLFFNPRDSTSSWPSKVQSQKEGLHPSSSMAISRFAYATFLTGPMTESTGNNSDESSFTSARVMAYQLLHSPKVKTNASIPFLVLVTPDVSESQRKRLTADGATVVRVEHMANTSHHPDTQRWAEGLGKLRLWEQTSYSKMLYLDADTLVTKRLDEVFYDEATLTQPTLANPAQVRADEGPLPRTYMFASHPDYAGQEDHSWPPDQALGFFSSGFFVLTPDTRVFRYYTSLLSVKARVENGPGLAERDLLNYAHRREGNMPWRNLWHGWNVNRPVATDYEGGAASFQARFWEEGDTTHDGLLKSIWREQRAEMEGFWRGRETKT